MENMANHVTETKFLYSATAIMQHFKGRKKVELPLEKAQAATKVLFQVMKAHQTDYIIIRNCLCCICDFGHGLDWCTESYDSLQLLTSLIQKHSIEQKRFNIRIYCLKLINFLSSKDNKTKEFMGSCGVIQTLAQLIQEKRNQCKFVNFKRFWMN